MKKNNNQDHNNRPGGQTLIPTPDISQKTIVAMNIYDYIQASGLTQAEIAKRAGLSTSALSAYVTGKNYPRPEQMAALAKVFGVSVGALTSTAEDKAEELNLDGNPEIREIVNILLHLPVEQRRFLLDVARTMRDRDA